MIGQFDPDDNRDPQLVSGGLLVLVKDIVLQQSKEALHRGVVIGRTDPANQADHLVMSDRVLQQPHQILCVTSPSK